MQNLKAEVLPSLLLTLNLACGSAGAGSLLSSQAALLCLFIPQRGPSKTHCHRFLKALSPLFAHHVQHSL